MPPSTALAAPLGARSAAMQRPRTTPPAAPHPDQVQEQELTVHTVTTETADEAITSLPAPLSPSREHDEFTMGTDINTEPETETESGISEKSIEDPGSSSANPVETNEVLHESVQKTQVHVTEASQGDEAITTVESVESTSAHSASSEAVGDEEATEDTDGTEDGREENDVEGADKTKAATSTANLASLRDLILRMAQNMDGKRMVEREVDDEDDLRLQEFERILGQLIAGSREGQHADSNATSTVADDGQTSAQEDASARAGEEAEAKTYSYH